LIWCEKKINAVKQKHFSMNNPKTEYCAALCSMPTCYPPQPVPPDFQHQKCAIICKSTLDGFPTGAAAAPRR